MLLNESFSYKLGKFNAQDGKVHEIAYIDPKESSTSVIDNKEIFKKYGANFNNKYKIWFWWLGTNPEKAIRTKVQPCIEALKEVEESDGSVYKRDVIATIDELIEQIPNIPYIEEAIDKEALKKRLETFKDDLLRATSDAEFKAMMEPIIRFRSANNYTYSFGNLILIMLQDPQATLVKSAGDWRKYYNMVPKKNAPKIALWHPTKQIPYRSKEEKEEVVREFLKKHNVKREEDLLPGQQEMLAKQLKMGHAKFWDLSPFWYDVRFMEQIPGTENVLGSPGDDIKWYDDSGEETPEIVRHIDALLEVIKDSGIALEFVDDLGGARGVSKSGAIDILVNQPKNTGMFNTIAHEFAHEMLHQTWLSSKDDSMKAYFVGKKEGRAKVEQQAELCAWIILRSFGYDMPTNINYVGIWGMNHDNAASVFDSVSEVATTIVDQIMQKEKLMAKQMTRQMAESKKYIKENNVPSGEEIAQMVGCGDVYRRSKRNQMDDSNVIRMSQNELTEIIKSTVDSMISEGLLDNMKSGFVNAGQSLSRVVDKAREKWD
jgi:hypothetical protein